MICAPEHRSLPRPPLVRNRRSARLPVRDIPARSLAGSMADHSRGHGNGSRQVARSRSFTGARKGTPITMLAIGNARCSLVMMQNTSGRVLQRCRCPGQNRVCLDAARSQRRT